jgi:NDP-sugar pyrophosphorylase family protein
LLQVVSGDKPAAAIQSWVTQEYSGPDKMQCEIVTVGEDHGTADALRAVANKITASTVVVLSGDLLIDLPVNALVASHLVGEDLHWVPGVLVEDRRSHCPDLKGQVWHAGLEMLSQHSFTALTA